MADTVHDQTMRQIYDPVRARIQEQARRWVRGRLNVYVHDQTWDQIWGRSWSPILNRVKRQIRTQRGSTIDQYGSIFVKLGLKMAQICYF